jgi:phosphoserine phosphatase
LITDMRHSSLDLSPAAMRHLLAVTRSLAAPFELKAMLVAVADAACEVLHVERSSVWLHDAATDELVLTVASDLRDVRVPMGIGLVGASARDRRVINVPDCYADPRFDPDIDRRSGFHTICSLSAPLIDHDGSLVGVLQVLNRVDGTFDADDELLAEALAAQCAVALSRARMAEAALRAERLRQELELARTVQLSSLPAQWPVLSDYDVHAVFQPAEQTGGDTYDLALTEQGLLVVLGDASGHGVAPALQVVQMHAMLRMALRLGTDLAAAFREVNDLLERTLPDGHFITAFVGMLDPQTHRLRFLSGGQGPILLRRGTTGAWLTHKATSFPMGAMTMTTTMAPVEIEVEPGDTLLLLSDGVFEYETVGGEQFGRRRVQDLLDAHPGIGAAGLCSALLNAVQAFAAGAPQGDDVTMVVVRRLPSSK